jgi:hypothetical protein
MTDDARLFIIALVFLAALASLVAGAAIGNIIVAQHAGENAQSTPIQTAPTVTPVQTAPAVGMIVAYTYGR